MSQHPPQPQDDPVADIAARVGEDALRAAVHRFYESIPTDPILGPMYPAHDFVGAEERLADFLVMRCGGSDRYAKTRGHPRLRMRHAPFAVDPTARDRWIEIMTGALRAEIQDDEVRTRLEDFLGQVATFLINRPPQAPG